MSKPSRGGLSLYSNDTGTERDADKRWLWVLRSNAGYQ